MKAPTFAARLLGALALAASLLAAAPGCHSQAEADFPQTATLRGPGRLPVTGPLLAMAPLAPTSDVPQTPFLAAPAPALPAKGPVRMWTTWEGDDSLPGMLRSQLAQRTRLPVVKELFEKAGVTFPPADLGFVAFKAEKELEVWATSETGGEAKKIATYAICAASGVLGPKRYEGDRQVPEGYYVISYGWAESAFHLEMKVSYPNMVDRVRGPRTRPLGGEIMIHGACGSIGCLAMSDERVEELWTMARTKRDAEVKVHIYPSRDLNALLRDPEHEKLHAFWQNLKEGKDRFDKDHRFFPVKADWRGVYMFGD